MKEYRIMAYFTDIYAPRSYKRKIVMNKNEAEKLFKEAKKYYSMYKYLDKVVIESREITEWNEENY